MSTACIDTTCEKTQKLCVRAKVVKHESCVLVLPAHYNTYKPCRQRKQEIAHSKIIIA